MIENIGDTQKLAFIVANSKLPREERVPFCNVGLWKYSRHPNYFGEWVAWIGLAVAAVEPLLRLEFDDVPLEVPSALVDLGFPSFSFDVPIENARRGLAVMLFCVCLSLYYCLSEWTGAIPAEYFSAQKREGYVDYQKTVNCLIPWFPSSLPEENQQARSRGKDDPSVASPDRRSARKRAPVNR